MFGMFHNDGEDSMATATLLREKQWQAIIDFIQMWTNKPTQKYSMHCNGKYIT